MELKSNYTIHKIQKILKKYHKNINLLKYYQLISSTNDVINTNNCFISICRTKFKNVIILSTIDNLIKEAGQAVQNMNRKFGFNQLEGFK